MGCVDFVLCGCVCMYWFCNVWVHVFVWVLSFVCVFIYEFCNMWVCVWVYVAFVMCGFYV